MTAIKVGHREGVVDSQEKEMIHGVFDFAGKTVMDVMRPRKEIVAFEVNQPLSDIENTIRSSEYSRIPIYEGEFDNIIGILYTKDLLRRATEAPEQGLRTILRPAQFVPETKSASSLLRDFRRRKIHIAIVVDEYGGISGLITLEDIIEEIIGEIRDKGDTAPHYVKIGPDRFRINARMEIGEFNDLLGATIRDESNVTIGGFLTSRAGKIPPEGFRYRHGDLVFTVSRAEKNRIDEIVVTRIKKQVQ